MLASLLLVLLFACQQPEKAPATAPAPDSLTEKQKHLPENALKGLAIADGLEVTPFAAEPMLQNPTNLDVDDRGRVWITEAYNYRPAINGNPTNALGDRIIILEDNNNDGRADTTKVFYQGPEINAPLGIAVLGNRVLISQSPYVWAFYDDNGDDKADRKEILFQGVGGEQHDHGMHAFSFGPDGKLYFNMGNEAQTLKDKNGKTILDGKTYKQGLTLRCDPDGSHVEVLGQNFRNPYEVAVDSYGALWQSDNDDDGNKGTRINAVFPHGQYGYTDELTGAGWQANRINIEDSIPLRHWHLNDPGAMPNLLQTGAGSPTGILVYEGKLFPDRFYGQLIHCDAGPNVVRAYEISAIGAGYTARIENILKGDKDPWFRPADIAVAPDGSLLIADWYDPGVGGHAAGDQVRGRVYRVAPKGSVYKMPAIDYSTTSSAVKALQSPNLATRFKAYTALQTMGNQATAALQSLWNDQNADARMRARAFWLLVKQAGADPLPLLKAAAKEKNENLRSMALRAAVQTGKGLDSLTVFLTNDPSAGVRREVALALWHTRMPSAPDTWAALARQHDGKDRWYLEALGIGADAQWDAFFAAWLAQVKNPLQTAATRDIVWRARTEAALPYLTSLAGDATQPVPDRRRYFRAFDFMPGHKKYQALLGILEKNTNGDLAVDKLVLQLLDKKTVGQSPVAQQALNRVMDAIRNTPAFIEMAARYQLRNRNNELLDIALTHPRESMGRDAAELLIKQGGEAAIWQVLKGADATRTQNLLASLGGVGSHRTVQLLEQVALSTTYDSATRKTAASQLGKSTAGEDRVLVLLRGGKMPSFLIAEFAGGVQNSWRGSVRDEAKTYLPNNDPQKLQEPVWADITALKADATAGEKIYVNNCATCHLAGKIGYDFGPALTEIGSKLPKEGLFEAIVHPSAGISFGYEGWNIVMKDGAAYAGILASKTETDLDIKFPGGGRKQMKTSEVKRITEMKKSMMTDGLYANMSSQDLANLLAWLVELKKK